MHAQWAEGQLDWISLKQDCSSCEKQHGSRGMCFDIGGRSSNVQQTSVWSLAIWAAWIWSSVENQAECKGHSDHGCQKSLRSLSQDRTPGTREANSLGPTYEQANDWRRYHHAAVGSNVSANGRLLNKGDERSFDLKIQRSWADQCSLYGCRSWRGRSPGFNSQRATWEKGRTCKAGQILQNISTYSFGDVSCAFVCWWKTLEMLTHGCTWPDSKLTSDRAWSFCLLPCLFAIPYISFLEPFLIGWLFCLLGIVW